MKTTETSRTCCTDKVSLNGALIRGFPSDPSSVVSVSPFSEPDSLLGVLEPFTATIDTLELSMHICKRARLPINPPTSFGALG